MRFLCILSLCVLSLPVFASSDYATKISLIKESLVDQQEIQRWDSHLLFPHLYGEWLTHNIQTISSDQADAFIEDPNNKAAAWFFKPRWRKELVRRKDWKEIEYAFVLHEDPVLVCHFFEARKALSLPIPDAKIESLWLSGQSRPDHCDPFFKEWIASRSDSDKLVWDRQIKAFYSRNGTLVRYLNRFYKSESAKTDGQFLSTVYNDPKHVVSKSYDPNSDRMHEVALAAVNRMAFRDPRSASNLWLAIVKATPNITQTEIRKASRYLGIAMAKQALPEAAYWLSIADADRSDEEVQHWRLQIALTQKDYAQVLSLYDQLSGKLKGSNQWKYWSGIARLKQDGYLSNDNPLYDLSTRRLYYGYLAAGVLGKEPTLGTNRDYPPTNTAALKNAQELQRAKALYEAGEVTRAQVEWNLYVRNKDNQTQHAAAELALSWGWYAKASQSAGWSGRYDLIHLRYPNAFNAIVSDQTNKLELPRYWVYGVMRQESRYEHTAVSPAGALGLMQVMPATASQTAKKHKLPYSGKSDLHVPETNITIGTHYLDDLLKRFDHPVLATAAYNAGPSRVNLWRERFPNEMTIWIESIPFNETRGYVKSVLAYSQIYALTHETDWHLASWTQPVGAFAQND